MYLLFCHCEAAQAALCPFTTSLRIRLNLENILVYLLSCYCERRVNPDRADRWSACPLSAPFTPLTHAALAHATRQYLNMAYLIWSAKIHFRFHSREFITGTQ